MFLKILENSQGNTCARDYFYLKRDSGTDVFLWSLQNLQNTSVGCFFIFYFEIFNIWVEYQINMFCALMFLSYVKSSISSMINNDSNTSSDNSELERKLPDFNILKPFKMEWISNINPRTSLANRYLIIAAGLNLVVFKTMDKVILPTIIFRVQTTILKRFYNAFLGQLRPNVKCPFSYSFRGMGGSYFHLH